MSKREYERELRCDVVVSVWSLICGVHSSYSFLNLISDYVVLTLDLSPFFHDQVTHPMFFNEEFLFPDSLRDFLLFCIWEFGTNGFSMPFSRMFLGHSS